MTMRRVLGGFAAGAMLAGALLLILQYVVDPYDYFDLPAMEGFNKFKPFVYDHARMSKTQAIVRQHPTALILGGSSMEGGLDPAHPALANWPSAYNAALPSGRFYESYRLLQHAIAQGRVELAIVSLDFINWAGIPTINAPGFSETALSMTLHGQPNADVLSPPSKQIFRPKFIGNGLVTLSYQDPRVLVKGTTHDRFPTHWYLKNGQRAHDSSQRYGIVYRGFDAPFRLYMQQQRARLVSISEDDFFPARVEGEDYFALIRRFVELSAEKNIRLIFMMPPCHISMLETQIASGVWEQFGVFKERIVAAIDAAERGTGRHIPVYDFCVYAQPNAEPIFSRPDQMVPPLTYWDPIHLNSRTGDLALSIMFGQVAPIEGFGVDLRGVGSIRHYMIQELSRREDLRRKMRDEFSSYASILH